MNDTNGQSNESRLDRLEASHVKLMTDCEIVWSQHREWMAEQEREWERQKERWKQHDIDRAESAARGKAIDERIDKLISVVGALMPRQEGPDGVRPDGP